MIKSGKKWLRRRSLVFKLSLGVLGSAFLGIVILLAIVTKQSETIIKEQILEHSVHTIKASVGNISHLVLETEQAVRNLRNTLSQLDTDDFEAMRIALNSTIKAVHNSGLDLSHAAIYSFPSENAASGTLYSAFAQNGEISFKSEHISNFYENFPKLKNIARKPKIFWSEPYISPNSPTRQIVITCVLPFKFRNQNTFNSLVSISVDLQDIQQYLENSPFQDEGKLVLLSKAGLYITHPNPEINLKMTIYELANRLNMPKLYEIGKKVLSGQSGYVQMPFSSVFGKPTIFFFAPIPHLDWGVCLMYSQKQLFKPVHDLQITIIISALAGLLILLILIDIICHYATKPLQQLSQIATQYGKGDFSAHIAANGSNDEIGALSAAFHNMRKNLLKYIEKERNEATEQQKHISELEIARQIQYAALPADFPKHKLFQIHALMRPARQIGGDFYDFFYLGKNKLGIVMADVSGKGISAALYMMRAQEIIKHTAQYTPSVAKTFERVNNILCEGNQACMFVSAFFAVVNLGTGDMEYVNAGHLPPFLIANRTCTKITPIQNFILGVRENIVYESEKIKLAPNSCLFLYTDGITEAENNKGEFYGEKRLHETLQKSPSSPDGMIASIYSDIEKFAQNTPQSDDITMLSFLYRGGADNSMDANADIQELANVLNFIKQDMAQKNIAPDICSKMIVIAEEIFSNIAFYAYDNKGSVRIQTSRSKKCYRVTFADSGKPYNPLEQQAPDTSINLTERTPGGLGIFIAKNLADSMKYAYKNKRNILTVEISTTVTHKK